MICVQKQTYASTLDSIEWKEVYKLKKDDLTSVTYGNGKFVAVGQNGAIKTSYQGDSWVDIPSKANSTLNKVKWLGNQFIAVGDEGTILCSNDGVTWESRKRETQKYLLDIAFSGKVFVAVGGYGEIITSKDGVSWIKGNSETEEDIQCILWDSNKFMAVTKQGLVLISRDGVNWTISEGSMGYYDNYSKHFKVPGSYTKDSKNLCIYDILWNKNEYIVTGLFGFKEYIKYTSNDGMNWRKEEFDIVDGTQPGLKYMVWDGKKVVSNPDLNGIAWNGEKYISVGEKGAIFASEDGAQWGAKVKPYEVKISSIATNNHIIVAVGRDNEYEGVVVVSLNGLEWREVDLTCQSGQIDSLTWGNGKFVACGRGSILISEDGYQWNRIESPHYITNILWTGNQFIATTGLQGYDGGYSIITSPDGVKWTVLKWILYPEFKDINYNGEKTIINGGNFVIDDRGEFKKNRFIPGFNAFKTIWDGEKYVGINTSKICTSKDASSWQEHIYAPLNNIKYFMGLEWGGGQFIAFGLQENTKDSKYKDDYDIVTLVSSDGVDWNILKDGKDKKLSRVKWCGDKLVAISQSGEMLIGNYKFMSIPVQDPVLKSRFEAGDKKLNVIMKRRVDGDEINGQYLNPESAAKIINDKLYITLGGLQGLVYEKIEVDTGNNTIKNKEKMVKTKTPIRVINGETYVPLRDLAECIGYKVTWDSGTSTAILVEE